MITLGGVLYDVETDLFRFPSDVQLRSPVSVCIRSHRYCGFCCWYCLSRSNDRMTRAGAGQLIAVLTQFQDWLPSRVVWSGGEPTLVDDFLSVLHRAKNFGCINVVATNGLHVEALKDRSVDWVSVSLHGTNREEHLAITGSDTFGTVIDSIKELVAIGKRVEASLVLTENVAPRLGKLATMLETVGIRRLRLDKMALLHGSNRKAANKTMPVQGNDGLNGQICAQVPGLCVVPPVKRKAAAFRAGYLVIGNDGYIELPNELAGLNPQEATHHPKWLNTLANHRHLFDGRAD